MGKEQVAVSGVNNFLAGEGVLNGNTSHQLDPSFKLYRQEVSPGHIIGLSHKLTLEQKLPRHYRPDGIEDGVVRDIEMDTVAICGLGENDALVTWGLADCLGVGMKVHEVDKKLFGLREKELAGRDYFVLAHFPYGFIGFNDLIGLVIQQYRVLGIAISASYEQLPSVMNTLQLPHLRIRGLNPQLKVIDERVTTFRDAAGMVVTRDGGAFLRQQGSKPYEVDSRWNWEK